MRLGIVAAVFHPSWKKSMQQSQSSDNLFSWKVPCLYLCFYVQLDNYNLVYTYSLQLYLIPGRAVVAPLLQETKNLSALVQTFQIKLPKLVAFRVLGYFSWVPDSEDKAAVEGK